MAQEIYASITVELPEDVSEAAQRHAAIAAAWAEMIAKIRDADTTGLDGVQCSISISEARAKRGPRRPRLTPLPGEDRLRVARGENIREKITPMGGKPTETAA
jgi:hypothetical protein